MNNFIRQIEERSFHSTWRKIDMGVHLKHTQNLQTKLSGSLKEDVNQTILLDARTQNYQGDKPQRCVGLSEGLAGLWGCRSARGRGFGDLGIPGPGPEDPESVSACPSCLLASPLCPLPSHRLTALPTLPPPLGCPAGCGSALCAALPPSWLQPCRSRCGHPT